MAFEGQYQQRGIGILPTTSIRPIPRSPGTPRRRRKRFSAISKSLRTLRITTDEKQHGRKTFRYDKRNAHRGNCGPPPETGSNLNLPID
jgi:hypothetical protein